MDVSLTLSPELGSELKNALEKGKKSRYACFDLTYDGGSDVVFSAGRADVNNILAIPYFSRYADKTQVYYLLANDDVTRRSLHVQLVSHISRTIGRALLLNTDLIEAIALSHDIGHAPFGHLGERFIDKILLARCGLHFNHSAQSVRVVEKIFPSHLSAETLCGVLCHCGKLFDNSCRISSENSQFPVKCSSSDIYKTVSSAFLKGKSVIDPLVANTLEAIVVRVSDIIAYIGKDREDALNLGYDFSFNQKMSNQDLIRYFVCDIVENSFGKPYVSMSADCLENLHSMRKENFDKIYSSSDFFALDESTLRPLFERLFDRFADDLKKKDMSSPIYRHHLNYIESYWRKNSIPGRMYGGIKNDIDLNLVVSDFISSMSDDYFISISKLYFPKLASHIKINGYFDGFNPNKRKNPKKDDTPSLFEAVLS